MPPPMQNHQGGSCCRGYGGKHQLGGEGVRGLFPLAPGCVSLRGALPSQPVPNRALSRALVAARADLLMALP